MQHQKTCLMAQTIFLLTEGDVEGCKTIKSTQNHTPLLPLLLLNAFLLSFNSTTANSSMFAPNMCGLSHRGSNLRHKNWLGRLGNQQQAEPAMRIM